MKQSCDTIEDDGKEKIEALHALKKIDASLILFTIFCSVESYTYVACLCLCHFLRSLLL